jgi:hypothetical protein
MPLSCGLGKDRSRMKGQSSADLVIAPKSSAVLEDRRRPGRVDYDNLSLIEMLRQQPASGIAESTEAVEDASHCLVPARAIVLAVLISAVMWCALASVVWMLLRH